MASHSTECLTVVHTPGAEDNRVDPAAPYNSRRRGIGYTVAFLTPQGFRSRAPQYTDFLDHPARNGHAAIDLVQFVFPSGRKRSGYADHIRRL
jgi:hypothetical protein